MEGKERWQYSSKRPTYARTCEREAPSVRPVPPLPNPVRSNRLTELTKITS